MITQSHLLNLFVHCQAGADRDTCSVSGLNSSLPAHLRRRNAIAPSPDSLLQMTVFGKPRGSSQFLRPHAQGSQNTLVPDEGRQVSGRSERSAASSGTEHSLWRDPDLEDSL